MPVINTRKRKPSTTETASPLDRLLTVSALVELNSPRPTDAVSDADDSASTFSGGVALDRIRRTEDASAKRRRTASDDDDESGDAEEIARIRALLRRPGESTDEWCSTQLRDEILLLQATVNTTLDCTRYGESSSSFSTPLEAVQHIHKSVRRIQSVLTEPVDAEVLASCTRASLELLWQQARESVDHEMRAKLTFWKRKAHDLRETLRASIQANAESATPSASLQDALDFVSTFYLLELAPDQSRAKDPFKGMAIAMATGTISHELQRLQSNRLRGTTPTAAQPLASSLLLLSQRAVESPRMTTTASEDAAAEQDSAASPPLENSVLRSAVSQDPSRMRYEFPTTATAFRATPTAATPVAPVLRSTTGSLTRRSATPVPAPSLPSTPHPNRASREGTFQKITAKGLSESTRRRLAKLLDSQRQTKSSASGTHAVSTPPPPPSAATTASSTESATVAQRASQFAPASAIRAAGARSAALDRALVSSSVASAAASPLAAPHPPQGSADGSDSDISHSGLGCATCGGNDSYSSLLLCDNGCEREFHTFCLQPPLEKIPEGDWYCPKCLAMERIQPGSRVYSCSAPLCNKITGAKYCTLHRCKFGQCLNRGNLGGFCRRHESFREAKVPRRSGTSSSDSTAKTTSPVPTAAVAPAAPAIPTRPRALNTEQLVNNMRLMGIWLPEDMMSGTANAAPTASNTITQNGSA